jgi:hypothetical protein
MRDTKHEQMFGIAPSAAPRNQNAQPIIAETRWLRNAAMEF